MSGTAAPGDNAIDHALYSIVLDDARGIVRIERLAVLRREEAQAYLVELETMIRRARMRFSKVRVLADLRGAPVRTREAAEALKDGNERLYRAGERVALVVDSMLLRLQLQRNQVKAHQELFADVASAEAWLLEA